MSIEGFDYTTVEVKRTRYRPGVGGEGDPVLLLHGFPETHYCWHRVAPALAAHNRVVVCDLKGYGETRSEPGGPLGEGYSNRERADELVGLMARLGFERFSVVGHDRGGRVAYRMALDHPEAVHRLAVLNVVPTLDQFERMAEGAALEYWPADPGAISEEATGHYLRAFNEEAIPGICADYRASFHIDRQRDAEDRDAGRLIACPVLVHWGAEEEALTDSLEIWRGWADRVDGGPLPSGHFIPEEAPEELTASLERFLGR
jgi:haloacetate dehalogenase